MRCTVLHQSLGVFHQPPLSRPGSSVQFLVWDCDTWLSYPTCYFLTSQHRQFSNDDLHYRLLHVTLRSNLTPPAERTLLPANYKTKFWSPQRVGGLQTKFIMLNYSFVAHRTDPTSGLSSSNQWRSIADACLAEYESYGLFCGALECSKSQDTATYCEEQFQSPK